MKNVLEHSGACVAFAADEAVFEQINAMHLPGLREVIGIDVSARAGMMRRSFDWALQAQPAPADAFAICYTSGTTGRPKGAVLSHSNLLWNATATARALECSEQDTFLLAVGITHIFGLSAGVLCAAVCGARLVLLTTFAAASALDLCEWEGVTVLHGTPTMFVLELAAQRRAPRDLHTLRTGIIAAAPVQPELVDQIRSELHCDVQIAWGLTETAPTVTITADGDPVEARRSSVGKPLAEAEIRIETEGHEYGEILVRSPGVFTGYYNDAELTSSAMTADGWFRTGDLGYVDAAGFLYLKGRKKEIIIRGGFHVYPDEVERLLLRLPWVRAAAVVGIPDAVLGERSCACIVTDDTANVPEDMLAAVRGAVSARLADYKLPDAVLRVDELPRTATGKVLKSALREDAVARIAAH
jgi:acyl-CoA synthetase (AMP-forming)/AMP-acid ligase II